MYGLSAVAAESVSSAYRSAFSRFASIPCTHFSSRSLAADVSSLIDSRRFRASSGTNTFSSKCPCRPPTVIAASFPITCAATWVTTSGITGFTFPGMIELPFCSSGSASSASPARGPEPISRRSLAIFVSETATTLSAPDASTSASRAACASNGLAGARMRRLVSSVSSSSAARWTADGKTSFDDWPMLTSSFACTSSPARAAITSFAFMFEEVPEPVWKTSMGNWSSSSPAATRSAALAIRSALSSSSSPSSAFTRAAAPLMRPSQRATGTGIGSPETRKFSIALRVSPPQRSWRVSVDTAASLARRSSSIETLATRSSRSAALTNVPRCCDRQSGSVCGVLRLHLLATHLGDRVVRRDRSLAHADRDQRDLAGVARDVAGGEDARKVRLARRRVDLDLAFPLELEAPVGDRPQVRVEAEQRDQRVALDLPRLAALGVLDRDRFDVAVAVDLAHLARRQDLHPAFGLELTRLVDGGLERTEIVPAVDEGDRMPGRVLQAERPVERRIAAADDDAGALPEDVLLAHEIVEAFALPRVDVVDPELARLEGAVACGDDQRTAEIRPALVRRDGQQLLAVLAEPLEGLHLFAEQHLRPVLQALFGAEVDERLALDLRVAGNVEDVLLGIDGSDLPTDLLQALDDPDGGVAVSRVVRGRQAGGAGPENRDVDDSTIAHDADASAELGGDSLFG